MITLQKALVAAIVVASVVTPLVVQRQSQIRLREQDRALQQQADQLAKLQAENERLSNLLAQARTVRPLPDDQFNELLKLRGQVGRSGREVQKLTQLTAADSTSGSNGVASMEQVWSGRLNQLKQWLEGNPSEQIPELQFLSDHDWLNSIYPNTLETPDEYSRAMSWVRSNAENQILRRLGLAFRQYARGNNGQLPTELSQLKAYLSSPIDDAILQRYEIVPANSLVKELQGDGDWVITQKAPVNEELDVRFVSGLTSGRMADYRVTNRWVRIP